MPSTLSNSAEIINALSEASDQDPEQVQRHAADLLYFVDEQFGPDFCMLVKICLHGVGHLTTGKMRNGRLRVRSTAAFEERFGYPFKVDMDKRETRWLVDYFDPPDEWSDRHTAQEMTPDV